MYLSLAVILLCLIAAAQGIHDIHHRVAQTTYESHCSLTLLDILKNDLKDLKQNNKQKNRKQDDQLKLLEDRYDDLVDKYAKLLQKTDDLQVKFEHFTTDDQGASGRDCADLYKKGVKMDGVYTITPDNSPSAIKVYCDMTTDGGGWTLFQKRMNGSVDFYRDWQTYKDGFGNPFGEHWLGNILIYTITNQRWYELRVDMEDADGNRRYAVYDNFAIESEAQKYKLALGSYSGNAGDSLSYHRGLAFSTKDKDNDSYGRNCAEDYKGAWWYKSCHHSNLNGLYHLGDHSSHADGVNWYAFKGYNHSLKKTDENASFRLQICLLY